MKATIDWDNPKRAFQQAFEAYARGSRKTLKQLAVRQISLAVRNILQLTPPMGGKAPTPYSVGKKRGEVRIIRDTRKTFRAVDPKEIRGIRKGSPAWQKFNALYGFRGLTAEQNLKAPESELLEFHLAQRGKNKRVRGSIKRPILRTKLQKLQRALVKRQGWGAGGWVEAAGKLRITGMPTWVKRWGSANKGTAVVRDLETGFEFLATNPTDFDASVQNRVDAALRMQAANMIRQVNDQVRKRKTL
jgi:hypothetical protein